MNKKGRFPIFWVLFGLMIVLFVGSFITPFKYVLDNVFSNMNSNPNALLRCGSEDSLWYIKATCFTLQGFMIIFISYLLYVVVQAMINGATSKTPILSNRYRQRQSALQQVIGGNA